MAPGNRNKPKTAASSDATYTTLDFLAEFPDDAACLDWLWRRLYSEDGEHADCPKCGKVRRFHRVVSRPSYSCDSCGQHVHPTAGTIFHKSSTSLRHWFHAVFLMSSTRCGISAKQLERELGVTYKTAWRMFHLIRELLLDDGEPLSGDVEMDEMYVGGRPRLADKASYAKAPNRRSAAQKWADNKRTPVFGMVERGGRVIAKVIPNVRHDTIMPHVKARVLPASIIYTDEHHVYDGVTAKGYQHKRIHHLAKVYVRGDVHTQTIDGFWSLVKRGISGTHHAVSAKFLQGYLDEYAWRYNHRHDTEPMFKTLLANVRDLREGPPLACE